MGFWQTEIEQGRGKSRQVAAGVVGTTSGTFQKGRCYP